VGLVTGIAINEGSALPVIANGLRLLGSRLGLRGSEAGGGKK
jgi:hypothetical protein